MRWLRTLVASMSLSMALGAAAHATVPGGIDVTCDVPRSGTPSFRTTASGQTAVTFKLWSAASGGSQIGTDYTVPMANLAVAKRYTDKFDSVRPRKAVRINATIGSDGSPVLLPVDGQAWLEVAVGATTLGCDFAATGDPAARRRLQSVAFSRESTHADTCDVCANSVEASVRVHNSISVPVPNHPVTIAHPFNSDRWDTCDMHSTTVNPTRLTACRDGTYYIFGQIMWDANASGYRQAWIRLNGVTSLVNYNAQIPAVPPTTTGQLVSTVYRLNAGDYVELMVNQFSGGTLDSLLAAGAEAPEFGMVRVN